MVHPEDDSATPRPLGRCLRNVILLVLAIISQTIKQHRRCYQGEYGASGRIRTSDRSVRSRVLYPAELRMQNGGEAGIRTPDAAFDRILP